MRSLGGWAQVLPLRRRGSKVAADERILGSGPFVEGLLAEAAQREKETLRPQRQRVSLASLGRQVIDAAGLHEDEFRSGLLRPDAVRARR